MTIEDIAKKYADQRVKSRIPAGYQNYSFELQKEQYIFDGYDIDDAVEFGARAVLEEIEKAWNSSSIGFIAEMAVIDKIKELKKG